MTDNPIPFHQQAVGDVLRWQCPEFPNVVHRWRIVGIHLGAVGQESLIECESLTHTPGWTGPMEFHPRVFIPEPLTRSLTIEDVGDQFGIPSSRRGAA